MFSEKWLIFPVLCYIYDIGMILLYNVLYPHLWFKLCFNFGALPNFLHYIT